MANYQYENYKDFLKAVEQAEKYAAEAIVPVTELRKEIRSFKKWITFYKNFSNDDLLEGKTVEIDGDEVDVVTATLLERKKDLYTAIQAVLKADHEETHRILTEEIRLHSKHSAGEMTDEEYQKALKKAVRDRKKLKI